MEMNGPRCVVTGHLHGAPAILSDQPLSDALEHPLGSAWELLWFPASPTRYDEGTPATTRRRLPPGGHSVELLRLEPGRSAQDVGWTHTRTQDLQVVLSGRIRLTLDHTELDLGPGDTIVHRAERHRLRALEDHTTLLATRLAPTTEANVEPVLGQGTDGASGVRRVVTGNRPDGTSEILHDGEPPGVNRVGPRVALTDVWQTGGILRSAGQGGDLATGWRVEPVGEGVAVGMVELPPGDYSDEANWHTTETIDVDVILSGAVELHLRGCPPVHLSVGDLVIQRGTDHRWQTIGDEPMRMATLRIGVHDPSKSESARIH